MIIEQTLNKLWRNYEETLKNQQ